MDPLQEKQVNMHRDLFVRCENAKYNGCYFEAILLEYAAIEDRLEVILGVLGLPCNKKLPAKIRKDIKISARIECLRRIRNKTNVFDGSKLDLKFYDKNGLLREWINERNVFVHGLYKSPEEYTKRIARAKMLASQGLELTKSLYNEAKRLRRAINKDPHRFECGEFCSKKCNVIVDREREN